jgi:lipoprotein signal peptidase
MSEKTDTPIQRAGRHGKSIALFVGLAVFTLAADLIVKEWAFLNVTDQALYLDRSPCDGTTIIQVKNDAGELELLPRARPGEPFVDANKNGCWDKGEKYEDLYPDGEYTGPDPASAIPQHRGLVVISKVFKFKLTINTGAVFGIGKGSQWLFVIVSILAVFFIGLVFYRLPADAKVLQICLALILGGAIGNLYDRLLFNGVRDMCYLFPGVKLPFGWHWPGGADELYPWIFNIADAALVIGVLVLLVLTWRGDKRAKSEKDEQAAVNATAK